MICKCHKHLNKLRLKYLSKLLNVDDITIINAITAHYGVYEKLNLSNYSDNDIKRILIDYIKNNS